MMRHRGTEYLGCHYCAAPLGAGSAAWMYYSGTTRRLTVMCAQCHRERFVLRTTLERRATRAAPAVAGRKRRAAGGPRPVKAERSEPSG